MWWSEPAALVVMIYLGSLACIFGVMTALHLATMLFGPIRINVNHRGAV